MLQDCSDLNVPQQNTDLIDWKQQTPTTMDNVSSAIEIQHPKPDIQLEKSNTELMHHKDTEYSAEPSGILPNYQAAYTKTYSIICYHCL